MKNKTLLIALWVSSLLFIFLTIGLFLLKFSKDTISNDPAVWGQFGDYFGGILNPILSLINLVILTYLSIRLVKNEDERNKWTLQELARPFGILHFDTNFKSLEIKINNCGLGPLIIDKITIEKDGLIFNNFYNLMENFINESNINPKIHTLHTGETKGAISKDQSLTILMIENNNDEDKLDDFKLFLKDVKIFLNKTKIEISNEDMYGRIMPLIEENINFPY